MRGQRPLFSDGGPASALITARLSRQPCWMETASGSTLSGADDNPLYWELLHATGRSTGLPVLYNTSFNLFGEPLVCDPRAAVRSFYALRHRRHVCGAFLAGKVVRSRPPSSVRHCWRSRFPYRPAIVPVGQPTS